MDLLAPFRWLWDMLKQGWNVLRTVYWYNSLPWRVLKAGALVLLGLFCLAGSNLLHSFKPSWDWLYYVMSYGFLLIIYGPTHHLVVIPVSLRLSHSDRGRRWRIGKRVPFWTLIAFFCAVPVLAHYPVDVMTFEFQGLTGARSADVDPDLACEVRGEQPEATVVCRLTGTEGIDHLDVQNGGRTVETVRDAPFEFSVPVAELQAVVGQKQFQIVLRDENGAMIRRYVRSVELLNRE